MFCDFQKIYVDYNTLQHITNYWGGHASYFQNRACPIHPFSPANNALSFAFSHISVDSNLICTIML